LVRPELKYYIKEQKSKETDRKGAKETDRKGAKEQRNS
jgi:hypothetical protein